MRKALKAARFTLVLSTLAALALGGILFARPPQDTFVRGFARQPQVRPVREVVVVDSRGKVVGAAVGGVGLGASGSITRPMSLVLIRMDQELVAIGVGPMGFHGGSLTYESANCQGTPWFIVGENPLPAVEDMSFLPAVAIASPGQTLYRVAPGASPRTLTVRSVFSGYAKCRPAWGEPFVGHPRDFVVLPTEPVLDLSTVYTPPFSLKALP